MNLDSLIPRGHSSTEVIGFYGFFRSNRYLNCLLLVCILFLSGCIEIGGTSKKEKPPTCDQPISIEVVSNNIQSTFYPGSKLEQARDLLDPVGNYHKYGMKFNTTVRVKNLNDADFLVKRSVGNLMIKSENMAQKNYESVLTEFRVGAKRDTTIHFDFRVDIASLSMDYFKMIVSSEKVGYFFKSSHKYSYLENSICADSSLIADQANAADSTIKDFVSIPEITDATYQGATTAAEATTASASWTIDNWDEIKCALFILVTILGIFLGGHAGSSGC